MLMETITAKKDSIAAHYHNTYDRAIENIIISLKYGIRVFDSSVAGLGGCPYAPGASGNVATEDVLFMCELLDLETNVNLKEIIKIGTNLMKHFKYDSRTSVKLEDLDKINDFKIDIQKKLKL